MQSLKNLNLNPLFEKISTEVSDESKNAQAISHKYTLNSGKAPCMCSCPRMQNNHKQFEFYWTGTCKQNKKINLQL